jgi:predicted RNA-binding protein
MMPRNWVIVTSEDNFEKTLARGLIGVTARRRAAIERAKREDRLVFYLVRKFSTNKDSRQHLGEVAGVGQVIGKPFESHERIWSGVGDEVFPYRLPVKVKKGKQRVRVIDIKDQLSFLRDKIRWGGFFLASFREIPDEDYEVIEQVLMGK